MAFTPLLPYLFHRPLFHHRFSFSCVGPPFLWRCALHITHGGDEGVDQAVVLALLGDAAEVIVHLIGVFADKVVGVVNAESLEITADGFADVRDVGEMLDAGSVHGRVGLSRIPFHQCPLGTSFGLRY